MIQINAKTILIYPMKRQPLRDTRDVEDDIPENDDGDDDGVVFGGGAGAGFVVIGVVLSSTAFGSCVGKVLILILILTTSKSTETVA